MTVTCRLNGHTDWRWWNRDWVCSIAPMKNHLLHLVSANCSSTADQQGRNWRFCKWRMRNGKWELRQNALVNWGEKEEKYFVTVCWPYHTHTQFQWERQYQHITITEHCDPHRVRKTEYSQKERPNGCREEAAVVASICSGSQSSTRRRRRAYCHIAERQRRRRRLRRQRHWQWHNYPDTGRQCL